MFKSGKEKEFSLSEEIWLDQAWSPWNIKEALQTSKASIFTSLRDVLIDDTKQSVSKKSTSGEIFMLCQFTMEVRRSTDYGQPYKSALYTNSGSLLEKRFLKQIRHHDEGIMKNGCSLYFIIN